MLGRRPGEYIVINGQIKIKVIKSPQGQLRLAIDAPEHIKIVRGELVAQAEEPPAAPERR